MGIKVLSNKKLFIKNMFIIVFGNILSAIAINGFLIPNKLLSGGIGGISIMIQYLTGIPTGIIVFLINIPIFIYGFKKVNKSFATYGFISMIVFSVILTLTRGIGGLINVNDVLVAAIVGGVLNGVGVGLLFKHRMCQDGVDIIVTIIRRKQGIPIGTSLITINGVIVILSSLIFEFRLAVYTIFGIITTAKLIDKIRVGFNVRKGVFIISDKEEIIAEAIRERLNRSVTFLEGMGSYKKQKGRVIYLIVNSNEVVRLKNIVQDLDPDAFTAINDVTEVSGNSFESLDI